MPLFTMRNDANCRVKCLVLHDKMTQILRLFNAVCKVFVVQRLQRCVVATFAMADVFIRMFPHFAFIYSYVILNCIRK